MTRLVRADVEGAGNQDENLRLPTGMALME